MLSIFHSTSQLQEAVHCCFSTLMPSLLLAYPTLLMDNSNVSEQADDQSGDVSTVKMTGHVEPVIPQEDSGTADGNAEKKDWRKSDKEWQEMKEKAKKGESAAEILQKLSQALGVKEEEVKEEKVDPLEVVTKKVDELQTKLALSEWEKLHPAVNNSENRDAWQDIVAKKGHLVKSGDLSYDDLWAIIRKGSKPSTSNQDFKHQELNIGSIPSASKTVVSGTEIDPDVYQAMRRKGWTDEQIKMSAM